MSNHFAKIWKNPFVVSILLVVLITWGLIYGTLLWLDKYTRHNQAVVIPDVKGLTVESAEPLLAERGIRYNIIDSVFSKDVPPGAIVELVPEPGSKVKEGRIVFVTINAKTSQMAAMPEVQDLSFRQAYALLRSTSRPKQAMYATIGTVLINIVLAPLFIYAFHWGIRGAALATVTAQLLVLLWQFRLFSRPGEMIRLRHGIYRLRRKIGACGEHIVTRPGYGYGFEA